MKRVFLVVLIASWAAAARAPDGTLAIIYTPNNGIPAMVQPGGTFEAVLTGKAPLQLLGPNGPIPLRIHWEERPSPFFHARCTVPAQTPTGCYALEAVARDQRDRNSRSVYVVESFPETYSLVHVTDSHIGSNRHPRPSEAIFRDLLSFINEMAEPGRSPEEGEVKPAFVLISGDLTEDGTADQFKKFVELLDHSVLPTFVCPGNHDRLAHNYEKNFGPATYMFRFGEDGYLAFDSKDFLTADELGPQDGQLETLRRAMAACRWAIGFTHRYEPLMGMRSQMVLFVDNPLDFLIFGHWHRENTEQEKRVPWGSTAITVTPAAIDGSLRLIRIGPYSITPHKVEFPVVPGK